MKVTTKDTHHYIASEIVDKFPEQALLYLSKLKNLLVLEKFKVVNLEEGKSLKDAIVTIDGKTVIRLQSGTWKEEDDLHFNENVSIQGVTKDNKHETETLMPRFYKLYIMSQMKEFCEKYSTVLR